MSPSATPATQSEGLSKPEDLMLQKMQPLSGNQHPDFLTSPVNMSLVLQPPEMHLHRSSKYPTPANVFETATPPLTFCSILIRNMMEYVHLFLPLRPCIHLGRKSGNFSKIVAFFLLDYVTSLGRVNFADFAAAQPSSRARFTVNFNVHFYSFWPRPTV